MSKAIRCAVYTRKSTEEGLDQSFNSLDAQREACAAYIKSQQGEGWQLVPGKYDDGGFSGGSIERPALQRLLQDIERGRVDCVVVYKIDRLTRSLADFAKIVERFDQRNVTFVSVTQSFNTTTSMGRLTLNVLLSFAQFEREVTAERIRDKFAASRAKGIFMGGTPPLGYDARDRKLVINAPEAKTVRLIFERYAALGSVGAVQEELEAKGIHTKAFTSTRGKSIGGGRWYIGPLRHLLRNPVYVGLAQHKGQLYAGQHEAIVPKPLFDKVQAMLSERARGWHRKRTVEASALLTGLVFDDKGNRMSPQWSLGRDGSRHCYYVSQAILQHRRESAGSLPRVAARTLDGLVEQVFASLVGEHMESNNGSDCDAAAVSSSVREVIASVVVHADKAVIETLREGQPMRAKQPSGPKLPADAIVVRLDKGLRITIPGPLKLRGGVRRVEGWDASDWSASKPRFDKTLIAALARAHRWREAVEQGVVVNIDAYANAEQINRRRMRELLRLAFLAPDIQRAILDGRQPVGLSLERLTTLGSPASWREQRRLLGVKQ